MLQWLTHCGLSVSYDLCHTFRKRCVTKAVSSHDLNHQGRNNSETLRNGGTHVNTLRPRRNEQYFADDIFKRIFFNWNVWISIKISLNFVPKGSINNIPALVQIMAWRRSGDKPLSEPMMRGGWGCEVFFWWAPSAKGKDHHGVSSGWSSVWHRSNTGLSSTQYEQIPIILGVWPFWLTPFFFSVNNILAGLWLNCISSSEITLFLLADILLQHRVLFQC